MKNYDKEAYISPKLFSSINSYRNNPEHDKLKSDTFSIGMTVLNAANLSSSFAVYNKNFAIIDQELLQGLLKRVKDKYSCQFQNKL